MIPTRLRFVDALERKSIPKILRLAKKIFKDKFVFERDSNQSHVLHVLAQNGTPEDLEELIKLDHNVLSLINLPNTQGDTPLHHAARAGQFEMVKVLLENGAFVAKANRNGDTPLHVAAQKGKGNIVDKLCAAGFAQNRQPISKDLPKVLHPKAFDIDAKNNQDKTAFALAPKSRKSFVRTIISSYKDNLQFEQALALIYQGKAQSLKKLVDLHEDLLESSDSNKDTLMHHALYAFKQTGHSCILTLLRRNVNLKAQNKFGQTAFLLASAMGIFEIETPNSRHLLIHYFQEAGADIFASDPKGFTALYFAAQNDNTQAIETLVSMGFRVDHVSIDGLTPLHVAAMHNRVKAIKSLSTLGHDIYSIAYPKALQAVTDQAAQINQPLSPLWFAVSANHVESVNFIFDEMVKQKHYKALQNLRGSDGGTLLHFFAIHNDLERFQESVSIGVSLVEKNSARVSAFHIACMNGNLPMIKYIVRQAVPSQSLYSRMWKGAFDINDPIEDNKTPLAIARENDHKQVVQYLRRHGARRQSQPKHSIAGKVYDFAQRQWQYSAQLENTNYYPWLNGSRVLMSTLLSYASGAIGMSVHIGHQALLYGMPGAICRAQDAYYHIKPTVHNYAPGFVETGLDVLATSSSWATSSAMKAVNILDVAANPYRRFTGFAMSLALANLAKRYTDDLDLQGVAYFAGREIGTMGFDAFEQYGKTTQEQHDLELIRAMKMWGSILGPTNGEILVNALHSFTQLHQAILDNVGWFEHHVLSGIQGGMQVIYDIIPECERLTQLQMSLHQVLAQVMPEWSIELNPTLLISNLQFYSREVLKYRELALKEIEEALTGVLPESEYKATALSYLRMHEHTLLEQDLQDAQNREDKAKEALKALEGRLAITSDELSPLDVQIEIARQEVDKAHRHTITCIERLEANQKAFEEVWQKTPVGAKEHAYKTTQQICYDDSIAQASLMVELDYLKSHGASSSDIQVVEQKLQQVEKQLRNGEQAMLDANQEWLGVMSTPERKYYQNQYEKIKTTMAKSVAGFKTQKLKVYEDFDSLKAQEQSGLDLVQQLAVFEQDYYYVYEAFKEIDLRIRAIDNPVPFIAENVVDNALDNNGKNTDGIVTVILQSFVATGAISTQDAKRQIEESLKNAVKSHRHKRDELIKTVTNHWNALRGDYRNGLVVVRHDLEQRCNVTKNEITQAKDALSTQNANIDKAKNSYLSRFSEEAQRQIVQEMGKNPILSRPHNWDYQSHSAAIKQTLIMLGQPEMAIGSIIYSDGAKSMHHQAASMARWLIDYQYLFVEAPSLDERLKEADTLAVQLSQSTITSDRVLQIKNRIDKQIAEQLLSDAPTNSQLKAQQVASRLEEVFRIGTAPLSEVITEKLTANDCNGALEAITSVLQAATKAFSLSKAGIYVPPVVEVHGPKKPRGFKRLWKHIEEEAKHYGSKLTKITGGISAGVSQDGITGGFTNGYQLPILPFSVKPQNVLNLPPKVPQPLLPVIPGPMMQLDETLVPKVAIQNSSVPFPARIPKEPLPRVLPQMVWEVQAKPLIFRTEQARHKATNQQKNDSKSKKDKEVTPAKVSIIDALLEQSKEGVQLKRDVQGQVVYKKTHSSSKPKGLKGLGEAILNVLIPTASACPPAFAALEQGVLTAIATGAALKPREEMKWEDHEFDTKTTFPTMEQLLLKLAGKYPDDELEASDLITISDQLIPGPASKTTFPIHSLKLLYMAGKLKHISQLNDNMDLALAYAFKKSEVASNVNAQRSLRRKLKALQKAQEDSVRSVDFGDGRIRYYGKETPAKKDGPTRGSAHVTEHNIATGQVRTWYESYDLEGNVNRVHPKSIDGQNLKAQHYPPTGNEINSFKKGSRNAK